MPAVDSKFYALLDPENGSFEHPPQAVVNDNNAD